MQEKSSGTIVFNNDQFLLLHYISGHWDFPKGHIESGESEQQTALRELEEETSIPKSMVSLVPGFKETIHYQYMRKGNLMNKTVVFFLVKTDQKDVKISSEHIGYKWLPYDQAIEQLTFENAKNMLRIAKKII